MSTRLEQRQVNKTANYTINSAVDKAGQIFTNFGAGGAITLTLPTPGQGVFGWWYQFHALAAQNVVIATPVADTLVAPGDLTADSVTLSVGGGARVTCLRNLTGVGGTYVWVVTDLTGTVTTHWTVQT